MNTQQMRKDSVEQAKHSNILEGLITSKAYDDDAEHYAVGEISATQLVELTRARFGLS
nr:antitoxin VbhA family protein [Corynebacterium lactis]